MELEFWRSEFLQNDDALFLFAIDFILEFVYSLHLSLITINILL